MSLVIFSSLCVCLSAADMRKIGSSRGAVTAYPRQLESLIRLAEAHAKMRSGTQCYMVWIDVLSGWLGFQVLWR